MSKALYRICLTHKSELGSLVWGAGGAPEPTVPSRAILGRWVSARFAGRAPEPPHGARGRSGVLLAFCTTLAHPFRSEGGLVCLAHRVRAWVAGSQQVCRKSPQASARSERAVRGPLDFFVQPSHILFVRTEGLFAEPTRVRTWVAGSRQTCRKSPLASAQSERAIRCSPGFLYAPRA